MGRSIEFDCRNCDEPGAVDSTSLNFIMSATGWDREECLLCDDCLGEELEGLTLDLSIGSDHTRSEAFEEAREQRKEERERGRVEHAKQRGTVAFVGTFTDVEWGEEKVSVTMPSEAKEDLKDLPWELAHPKFNQSRKEWTVDLAALEDAVEHMENLGWTTEVSPEVREQAA